MKNRRLKLVLTATAGALVAGNAVALVSAVPEIAPDLALAGILAGGVALSSALALSRRGKAALLTLAMFLALLPLLAVAGGHAFLLWTAAWASVACACKRLIAVAPVVVSESVTRA